MPCLITALTRSATEKTTKKNNKQQNKRKQISRQKNQYLNLKTPSKNVKMQSDEILTTQIYFLLT